MCVFSPCLGNAPIPAPQALYLKMAIGLYFQATWKYAWPTYKNGAELATRIFFLADCLSPIIPI